ncbi:MAG: D-alanine--D-alanine ligase [bacterium]|nr:D-alanine--D-alanine ligase [bacterium]
MNHRKRVAVLFGGRSPEHDVSIVTGLQALNAVDTTRYDPFPVYVDLSGQWWIGDALRQKSTHLPLVEHKESLTPVLLDLKPGAGGVLHPQKKSLFKKSAPVSFDVALLAFHGLSGENGDLQGALELADVPYTGAHVTASSIFMDKVLTKEMLSSKGVPLLSHVVIQKPKEGLLLSPPVLKDVCKGLTFPCCVKPRSLGSSIGVARVETPEELNAVLPGVFQYDTHALVEPFVENLVEYNVAVRRDAKEGIVLSAIERPKCSEDLLDFKQKYCASGDSKTGVKNPSANSEGMLSLTRDIAPKLDPKITETITHSAKTAFALMEGTGAPRIDFLSNKKTGEVWFNEVNPCPGSFGYYLWEAAQDPLLFTELLTHLLEEAETQHGATSLPFDPVPEGARLFRR